jgi:chromosomal replication initiator protein
MEICFAIDPSLFQAARRAEAQETPAAVEAAPAPPGQPSGPPTRLAGASPRRPPTRRPRHWRKLTDFVVGPCNRVAHASALSIIEAPGQGPNLLVLHGPVGTGKSHLLEGTYVGLRKAHPDWRIRFTTAEEFTNRFVQAMRLGKLGAFRHHFRECEALLLDDLQFLTGKRATQEEFLHTFDALQTGGGQLVLTCDCHPRLADELTPELCDRLLGGAVWGLAPPDADTRLTLLRALAARGEPSVSEEIVRFLASQLHGNVRELQGALQGLRHYARVSGRIIDLELARQVLGDLLCHVVRTWQLPDIDRAVCAALRLEPGSLQSKDRGWTITHPRMLAIYLARKHTAAAYSEIGRYFGGRNHSTAVAAEKKVRRWLEVDDGLIVGDRRLRAREVLETVERTLMR